MQEGVRLQRPVDVCSLPVAVHILVHVPVDGALQAVLPRDALLPTQRRQFVVADEVPAASLHIWVCPLQTQSRFSLFSACRGVPLPGGYSLLRVQF